MARDEYPGDQLTGWDAKTIRKYQTSARGRFEGPDRPTSARLRIWASCESPCGDALA
jgi:hypothetical protein